MRYRKGDKVRIKSREWYNANKNSEGAVLFNGLRIFDEDMSKFCGKVVTIEAYNGRWHSYDIKEDGKVNFWYDEMFEGLAIEDELQEKMVSLDRACEYLESALEPVLGYYSAAEFTGTFRKVMEGKL